MVFISYLYGIYMVFSTYPERRESQSTTPEKREFDEFIQLYIVDYHVVERALKERYLIGQSVRAVIFVDIGGMRSVGPTPIVLVCFQVSCFGFPFALGR